MSHERLIEAETKEYTVLSNQNLLDWWGANGSEWTSSMREECLALTNQPLEKGKSGSTRGMVLLGALAALGLVGAATLTQIPVTSSTPQANAKVVSAK